MNPFRRTFSFVALAAILLFGFAARAEAQPQMPPDDGTGGGDPGTPALTAMQQLGQFIFLDTTLSSPDGQSCASCHHADYGWADARSAQNPVNRPTSEGAVAGRFGPRNGMPATYADLTPNRFFDAATGGWIGGRYRDGRAANGIDQAKIPFLSPVEMNNPSVHRVVLQVKKSSYAPIFEAAFGKDIWNDKDLAFQKIAQCLAAFETAPALNRFSSRFDKFRAGDLAALTAKERAGLALFEGRGRCTGCHPSQIRPDGGKALFSTFRYYNLGVPKNPRNPFYDMPASVNPQGRNFVDLGLGGPDALNLASERGKFKVPTLRNVALTPPYMHNGVFSTLGDAVQFHNTRDIESRWGPPEVAVNLATGPWAVISLVAPEGPTLPPEPPEEPGGAPVRLGNLMLTVVEVDEIVAFLRTLSDSAVAQ